MRKEFNAGKNIRYGEGLLLRNLNCLLLMEPL